MHTVRRPRPGRTEIRFEVDQVYKGTAYLVAALGAATVALAWRRRLSG